MSKKKNRVSRINRLHLWTLIARYSRQTVNSVKSMLMFLLQMPVMLLLIALVNNKDSFTDPQKRVEAMTIILILVLISCFMALLNSYREITKERDILAREVAGGLDQVSYVTSKYFVLIAIVFVQSLILTLGSLAFVKFNFNSPFSGYLAYFLSVFLSGVASTSIGLFISAVVKKSESAILPVLLVMIILLMFSGTLMDFQGAMEYVVYISPSYWALVILGRAIGFQNDIKHKAMFDQSTALAIVVLLIIIVVFYLLTVWTVKLRNKSKK